MLHAAVVPVDRHPVLQRLFAGQRIGVVRVGIAQKIPRRTGPLGHRVRLAPGRAAAARAGRVDPLRHVGQGRLAVVGQRVGTDVRQPQRELVFRHRDIAAFRAADDGDRLAPVPLAREDPVAQLVVDLGAPDALLCKEFRDFLFRLLHGQAVQDSGVDHGSRVAVRKSLLLDVAARDDLHNGKAEFFGERPVARVVGGDRHDGARPVGHQHVIGDENRDFFSIHGVDRAHAVQPDAGLLFILGKLGALKIRFSGRLVPIGADLVPVFDLRGPFFQIGMLGGKDHIGRAVERVRPGGVDGQDVPRRRGEIHFRSGRAADPVALLRLHALRVIDQVEVVYQSLRIGRDFEHPLRLHLPDDFAAAPLADAVHDLLVGQHAFARSAPVDGHLFFVGEAALEKLQENPLRPPVVFRIRRVDFTGPIERKPKGLKLLPEPGDVLPGDDGGMNVVFDGVILGRKAERVPADRVQHVVALHAALARDDVHRRVGARMPHMQPLPRRVRELDQRVVFRSGKIVGSMKHARFFPSFLPFALNLLWIVFHFWFVPSLKSE